MSLHSLALISSSPIGEGPNFRLDIDAQSAAQSERWRATVTFREDTMRTTHWVMTAILGLLLTSCAGISTAPTTEGRQALPPTGKLRVGLQLGNPLNVIRDSASGEMKGRI